MSFDVDDFIGLARGGDAFGAPAGSHDEYGYAYGAGDNPDYPVEPLDFEGSTFDCTQWDIFDNASTVQCPSKLMDEIDIDRPVSAFRRLTDVGYDYFGDLATPPDFFTIRVDCGFVLEGLDEPALRAWSSGCKDHASGGGCADGPPISYVTEFEHLGTGPAGTILPDIVLGSPADGDNRALFAYLERPTAAYAGDPANTASTLLWPFDEIDAVRWLTNRDDDTQLHNVALPTGNLTFTLRPFWVKPKAARVMLV